ncbi:MAG TPA: CBS domain-containing protein [Candidatus Hydrogenedentes bacterium]|nr:CBS domain-containing protein [Candidatus Hydrogenedentota bacterium]
MIQNIPLARDCMSTWYTTLKPDMEIYKAIDILEHKRAAGAPVVDDDGNLLGILTEKDCLRVISNAAYEGLATGTVRDYMSEPKVIVTTDMDLFAVAKQFLSTNFAVLPVVENGKPVGRISRQDMLRGIQVMQREAEKEKAKEERTLDSYTRPRSIGQMQQLAGRLEPRQLAAVMRERLNG